MRSMEYKLYKYLSKWTALYDIYGKIFAWSIRIQEILSSATEGFQTDDQSYSSLSMDTAMQSCAEFPENFLFFFNYSIHLYLCECICL